MSEYIRFTITQKKSSIWIAQRNGRTKNGNDKTEEGLLKMLNMSGTSSIAANFNELNIIPLAISYEIEPCALAKVNETYISQTTQYIKQPGEDLKSIISGFVEHKGRIHLSVGNPIYLNEEDFEQTKCKNEHFHRIAQMIDEQIHANYKLFERNYIAYDVLNNSQSNHTKYTTEQYHQFMAFVETEIAKLQGDKKQLRQLYLELYAAPVRNKKIN